MKIEACRKAFDEYILTSDDAKSFRINGPLGEELFVTCIEYAKRFGLSEKKAQKLYNDCVILSF
jgi:hypothetical protein